MRVNIGNALETASPVGVPRAALDRLDRRVGRAHERIQAGRDDSEMGYAALDLPQVTDASEIRQTVEPFRDKRVFLTIGIGGSALGAATLTSALDGTGAAGGDGRETVVLDNIDPEHVGGLLESIPLEETVINVVSKSGTTAETQANFLLARDAMTAAGVDWTESTIVTTGEDGPLRDLANEYGLPTLPVPERVPGRFSVLSPVGLAAAAFEGHDIEAILDGASAADDTLSQSLFETPAYAYGAVTYALDQRGIGTNVMIPYAESLEDFAEWFAQLSAESLGKDGLGQTPVRALGATDQHSQLQLYRAGPLDKLLTLLRPERRVDTDIPAAETPEFDYLRGASMQDLIDAEFEATEASLRDAGVPTVRIEIDAVEEYPLGELLYSMEAACILAGELYGVDTFTQPAVEWGKTAAKDLLRGERSLSDREELVVEG
ncbi:MAG: glucose-6-phosphate isomerase [Halodesulfurarchaeum sp.]